jgi:AcrR family transcriptional regulator
MARWEPNARERLVESAMALFEERGYARTTVSDIVRRAKLGDRTFFRYFSDKREVLFSGSDVMAKLVADAVAAAPKAATPVEVVLGAIDATARVIEAGGDFPRRRLALVAAHAELQERELTKSTQLAALLAAGLRARGLSAGTAELLAMTGMVVFQNALGRWAHDAQGRDLKHHVRKAFAELRTLMVRTEPEPEAAARRRPAPRS